MNDMLWYKKPAKEWKEGLPIGNGRLAAMIWGDESTDRLSLNHEWLWRGIHKNRDNGKVAEHLSEIRKLINENKYFHATCLANAYLAGGGGVSDQKTRVDTYQPAGDLLFELTNSTFIKRQLDIKNAVASVERTIDEVKVYSTFIAHPEYNLIIGRWDSDNGQFCGKMSFVRPIDPDADEMISISDNKIEFYCSFHKGISYKVKINIETDGKTISSDKHLNIENATYVLTYINIATSESGMDKEFLRYPVPKSTWNEILLSHQQAFSKVMSRLSLNVNLPQNNIPTNEMIDNVKSGIEDPNVVLLYFNFGRYLLISSSISGELPANLQGKWNYDITPPWESDYHLDINLQMNYWMSEPCNMPECSEALLKFVERLIPHGKKAANDLYGCRGVFLPIQTDAWGRATVESCGWAVWIGAAPWIAQHFWWHYEYNGDMKFLKDRAYPFFKEIANFYEDYLIEDSDGILQIIPSQSPENRFEGTSFWPVSIGKSSAMDVQLAYDALGYAIKSAKILGVDLDLIKKWSEMQSNLPSFAIGNDGRLLEWDIERKEVEPGHRHVSHLYGMYPSNLFNPIDRPKQYEAAMKSLEYRLSQGGGHTGWSRAWVACLYARIGDSNKLWEHIYALITDFATISLLDLHPPRVFQIDGNFGGTAAIIESIVQCWGNKVHLLRALPKAWKDGSLLGVKVVGGHVLDIYWVNGELTKIKVKIGFGEKIIISDIANKFTHFNSNISIQENDVCISGKSGEIVVLQKETQSSNNL